MLMGLPRVNVMDWLRQIDALMRRYNGGERSDELFDEMDAIE